MDTTWLPTILLLGGFALLILNGFIASRYILKEVKVAQAKSIETKTYQKPNIDTKKMLPFLAGWVVAISLILISFFI